MTHAPTTRATQASATQASAAREVRAYASTDPSDPQLADAVAALTPAFSTKPDGVRVVRRTWLDTFDERLHNAGLVLEHGTRDGETYLELTARDGARLRAPAPALTWPAFAADLPPSPLQERVAAVTDTRALLEVGRFRSRQHDIRVLNDDGKTVARLTVDVPVGTAHDGEPTVVSVTPVRGYQAEADKVASALAAAPGAMPAGPPRHEQARLRARPAVDEATTTAVPLTAELPAATAVAGVLTTFRRAVETNVPGLLADIDTEFLHDLRVAVRRARSTVKLTGHALQDDRTEWLAAELKWLGDLTSPTRDLDVYLLGIPAMARGLRSSPPSDLQPFQQHLERRRDLEQRRLVQGVRSRRFRTLVDGWRDIAAVERRDPTTGAGQTAAALARDSVGLAHRRVVKLGSSITPDSPAEDLHTLRKRCKELRYLLEIFAPVHDKAAHKQVLQVLKALQECLGDFQDSEVQADALRSFAGEMSLDGAATPGTLLAMGELSAALHAAQESARSAFAGTFAAFMRPKNQRSFAALQPAARDARKAPAPPRTKEKVAG